LIRALRDSSWEVRQSAVKVLGTLGEAAAVDGLCQALRDKDRDVREGAAMALGRIGDARGIYSLVVALLDTESAVRNAANNSLQQIDRHWLRAAGARQALPEIETALNHREYWVRHSATKLMEQLGSMVSDAPAAPPSPAPPAQPPGHSAHAAFAILADLLRDPDRDLRLAAAAAFGQLREKSAKSILTDAARDTDHFVKQAAQDALTAFN
jgi:HEAT repeat protein